MSIYEYICTKWLNIHKPLIDPLSMFEKKRENSTLLVVNAEKMTSRSLEPD